MEIVKFPNSVWLHIFRFIEDLKELKNLTLVCKEFTRIISTDTVISSRFLLELMPGAPHQEILMNSIRNYRNIKLSKAMTLPISLLKILEKFGSLVEYMEFNECELTDIAFKLVFNYIGKSVKQIDFIHSRVKQNQEVSITASRYPNDTNTSFPNLKKLWVYKSEIYFKEFNNLLTTLSIANSNADFLQNQCNLQELYLDEMGTETLFACYHRLAPFKLKTAHLYLSSFNLTDIATGFFLDQANSLRNLKIGCGAIDQRILQFIFGFMVVLEKFELHCTQIIRHCVVPEINILSETLTHLKITEEFNDSSSCMFKQLPLLEHLEIGSDSPQFLIDSSSKCPKITHLTLLRFKDDAEFQNVHFPSLKCLTICWDSSFLLKNVIQNHPALEKLIIKGELNEEQLRHILENAKNLRHLEIWNGCRLDQYSLLMVWPYMKKLKILKIYKYENMKDQEVPWYIKRIVGLQCFITA